MFSARKIRSLWSVVVPVLGVGALGGSGGSHHLTDSSNPFHSGPNMGLVPKTFLKTNIDTSH